MNLSLFIARKYFWSKNKKNFINVISIISMVGVAIGTAALVIVLSVFNGLEDFIRSLFRSFDPDLKIVAAEGKTFEITEELLETVRNTPGIAYFSEIVEDNALIRYRDNQVVVTVKGVEEDFLKRGGLGQRMLYGELGFERDGIQYAILGRGIQYALSVSTLDDFNALQFFYPKRGRVRSIDLSNPGGISNIKNIMPGGIFTIEKQYDEQYVFVPLAFAQDLMEYQERRTAIEALVSGNTSVKKVQKELMKRLGPEFKVLNADQQHSSLLKAIQIEKLFVYLTFSFILAVASFNIFFSLSMLALDKKRDIGILYAMGATDKIIRRIFIYEGSIIAFSGAAIGLMLGLIVCSLQQYFGLVSMGMATSILDAYPVKMQWPDFVYTAIAILVITYLASFQPARLATRSDVKEVVK